MSDLAQKLLIAFMAFLLGLVAEVLKRLLSKERKRLAYAIDLRPIIATTAALPNDVKQKMPDVEAINITEVIVTVENVGTRAIQDASLLVATPEEAEVIHQEIRTLPIREVSSGNVTIEAEKDIRVSGFSLERKQRLILRYFLRSEREPNVALYGSGGGGDVRWVAEGASKAIGIEGRVTAIVRYFVLAQILPPLLTAVSFSLYKLYTEDHRFEFVAAMVGQATGTLIALYYYLRIVPQALAVANEASERLRNFAAQRRGSGA